MAVYKTPGVYIEEISTLPPSVAQVETAIPAFIGYTMNDTHKGETLVNAPRRIKSFTEFEEIFGRAITTFTITVNAQDELQPIADPGLTFRMNYAMKLYFANGGGPCYICSAGKSISDNSAAKLTKLQAGLAAVKKEDEPTMLLFPDAPALGEDDFYTIYKDALAQCAELGDRVTLVDVRNTGAQTFSAVEATFRTKIGNNHLKYGAAYYPWLRTTLNYDYDEVAQTVSGGSVNGDTLTKIPTPPAVALTPVQEGDSLFHTHNELYHKIKDAISKHFVVMPPSAAIAGVYAQVDSTRGVWKAPANVSLNFVKEPMVRIDDDDQQDMNVTGTGKSVNAIRQFTGKGVMVWGARTLAGNDNEWRYVPVRRFFNMVEESVKKATFQFVFEPNDANTWVKVRSMIENFLVLQWRAGALQGAKPEDAFYVRVGLGQTMTALDILEGRMNVEIGMAVVRPAEFIILKFSHKMQTS
jgi:hypothetical protein